MKKLFSYIALFSAAIIPPAVAKVSYSVQAESYSSRQAYPSHQASPEPVNRHHKFSHHTKRAKIHGRAIHPHHQMHRVHPHHRSAHPRHIEMRSYGVKQIPRHERGLLVPQIRSKGQHLTPSRPVLHYRPYDPRDNF